MEAALAGLKPPPDFMPEGLELLLSVYPGRYGREPLANWINAAIGYAVPEDEEQQEPNGIRQRLRLYAYAMLRVAADRKAAGDARAAEFDAEIPFLAHWIGALDRAAADFAAFDGCFRSMVAALRTFSDPRQAVLVAFGMGEGRPTAPFLMCYARTLYDSHLASAPGRLSWEDYTDVLLE
eukprot:TRINITY_DN5396_c0_g4_i1.p1 TRINITY_DN5396_c0_g4~~TRINITY_DN5396_c0_g4_i1.p1  ORF type:complete len:180 (-),score=39.83 TRINITY_DN5396_c0_g4_i1:186-725(-)